MQKKQINKVIFMAGVALQVVFLWLTLRTHHYLLTASLLCVFTLLMCFFSGMAALRTGHEQMKKILEDHFLSVNQGNHHTVQLTQLHLTLASLKKDRN